jgi:type IV pilus assembly protein PilN
LIRVNLIRLKKSRRQEAGQRQLLYMGLGVLAAIGTVVFVHIQATGELETLQQENGRLQADITRLKAELGDYDKVKAQREELLKQRKSIQALEAGRTGPVYLLRELSEILTRGKGPTFDRVSYEEALRRDPNVGFNASWDPRRAWLESFEENQKKVRIRGAAKSHDDAAEFMKRLNSSVFFNAVRLENASQVQQAGGVIRHITFNLNAEVIY